jgi:hypothetical protein
MAKNIKSRHEVNVKNNKLVDKNKLMRDKVKKNTMKNSMSILKKSLTKMKMI